MSLWASLCLSSLCVYFCSQNTCPNIMADVPIPSAEGPGSCSQGSPQPLWKNLKIPKGNAVGGGGCQDRDSGTDNERSRTHSGAGGTCSSCLFVPELFGLHLGFPEASRGAPEARVRGGRGGRGSEGGDRWLHSALIFPGALCLLSQPFTSSFPLPPPQLLRCNHVAELPWKLWSSI